MRLSERNKQPIHYATYSSKTEILDEYDNPTGAYTVTYSNPVSANWNVGYVESEAEVQAFGIQAVDTIVVVAEKDGFPLDESSILWYGITPTLEENGTTKTPHNYRIAGIRPSLNTVKFYAQKVDVTQAVEEGGGS